jgi:hypothetical protein
LKKREKGENGDEGRLYTSDVSCKRRTTMEDTGVSEKLRKKISPL